MPLTYFREERDTLEFGKSIFEALKNSGFFVLQSCQQITHYQVPRKGSGKRTGPFQSSVMAFYP